MYKIAPSLLVFLVVAIMTAPFVMTVTPNCDLFSSLQRYNQSTCQGSSIEYGADGSVLTVNASLANCASATPESTVSVFFDQVITPIIDQNANTWILSYSIMWNDPATNCVVDVTTTDTSITPALSYSLPNDTNGLNNHPLTNISEYALNQWYTRSFVINGSALSSFRFGFTCASQTPGTNLQQVAFVKDITWKSGSNEGIVYNSSKSCAACNHYSPIEGANCLLYGNEYRWTYEGNIDLAYLNLRAPLTVLGNVTTSQLKVRGLLDIHGCLIAKTNVYSGYDQIEIIGFRESKIVILSDPGCGWPRYFVTPTDAQAVYQDNSVCPGNDTPYTTSNGSDVTTVTDNSILIYVPNSIFECYHYDYNYTWIAYIIVPIVVGVVGIVIGIVFGVRKYRRVQRAKQLEAEMEHQSGLIDPTQH